MTGEQCNDLQSEIQLLQKFCNLAIERVLLLKKKKNLR